MRLQVALCYARDSDAVTVAELDGCIAVGVARDERRQLLDRFDIGEMVKFDRIAVRIEVRDRLGTHVRMEHEGVVAGAANG